MVAAMTHLLELKANDVVLEIGTGLGYQAAVLAELAGRVYSVEIIDVLAQGAVQRLKGQGYTNVAVRVGNGYSGWPEHAPFDKVIVTAAPDLIPPSLINQLKAGGRMVIPVGLPDAHLLVVADKDMNGRVRTKEIMQVSFSLLALAGKQDVRRPPDAGVVQRVAGASKLLFVQNPGDGIQSRPADVHRHVCGVQTGLDGFRLQLEVQILAQRAGLFDFLLVRVQLVDHELPRRFDDHLLFIAERKIHDESPFAYRARRARPVLAHCRSRSNCKRSCSTCLCAGQSFGLVTAPAVNPLMNVTTDRST